MGGGREVVWPAVMPASPQPLAVGSTGLLSVQPWSGPLYEARPAWRLAGGGSGAREECFVGVVCRRAEADPDRWRGGSLSIMPPPMLVVGAADCCGSPFRKLTTGPRPLPGVAWWCPWARGAAGRVGAAECGCRGGRPSELASALAVYLAYGVRLVVPERVGWLDSGRPPCGRGPARWLQSPAWWPTLPPPDRNSPVPAGPNTSESVLVPSPWLAVDRDGLEALPGSCWLELPMRPDCTADSGP